MRCPPPGPRGARWLFGPRQPKVVHSVSRRTEASRVAQETFLQNDIRLGVGVTLVMLGLCGAAAGPYLAMDPQVGDKNWLWALPGLALAAVGVVLIGGVQRRWRLHVRSVQETPASESAPVLPALDKAIALQRQQLQAITFGFVGFLLVCIPYAVWTGVSLAASKRAHAAWWALAALLVLAWNGVSVHTLRKRLRELESHRAAVAKLDALQR